MKKSRACLVREWLQTQSGPRSGAEIATGIGMADDALRVHWAIGVMYRDGVLERIGEARGYRYSLGRAVKQALSPQDARKRRTERERARFRNKGVRPLAEYLAMRRQRSLERAEAKRIERERRFAESKQQRAQAKARAASDRKARIQTPPRRLRLVAKLEQAPAPPPKPEVPRLETVAEFEARGGRIQKLPTSWESREQQAA